MCHVPAASDSRSERRNIMHIMGGWEVSKKLFAQTANNSKSLDREQCEHYECPMCSNLCLRMRALAGDA